ncbi:MAG: HAMP domain-containing sensor histidine kinase [Candidatus Kapaibacterium sp.]
MSSQPTQAAIPNDRTRINQSLFGKVLVLVLATAVIATVSIGLYFRYVLRDTYEGFLREQVGSYMQMAVDDIGFPPDTAIALKLARLYPIDIRMEREGFSWATDPKVPSRAAIIASTRPGMYDRGDSLLFRGFDGRLNGVVKRGGWHYTIRLRSTPGEEMFVPATIILGVVLTLLFIAAYLLVQRFLRPISLLMAGVKAVASEDFDHHVQVSSHDELGELTNAFNAMSQRVAAIIASKRRLLFDVSHELRSPLTRMNVALAMLPEGKAKISIERNIRELNTMITELLENERLAVLGGVLVVETIDIVSLVGTVMESFGYDQQRIELDSLTGALEITADGQRLAIAVRNLISNALKYSSEKDGPVTVTVFPDDDGARIVVADQGIGISVEAQKMVFEPFYRTDDSRSRATGGYGLGLSLTKAIVEAHGGTIQLSSTLGCGTTIMIWLPHAPAAGATVRNMKLKQPASAA